MATQITALVLDDDPVSQDLISTLLQEEVSDIKVTCRSAPNYKGAFDIYFIDNDFGGAPRASSLAASIRKENPDKLIIAFSGTLDSEVLKELLNAGCNGVCDKSTPSDMPAALRIVRKYVEEVRETGQVTPGPVGIVGAIRSISELLREWNSRLDRQEKNLKSGN